MHYELFNCIAKFRKDRSSGCGAKGTLVLRHALSNYRVCHSCDISRLMASRLGSMHLASQVHLIFLY